MGHYRYQFKSQADFTMVAAWCIEHNVCFTSQFVINSPVDKKYFITVDFTSCDLETAAKLGQLLDKDAPSFMHADYMEDFHATAEEASEDPFCDAHTLHVMLDSALNDARVLRENTDEAVKSLNGEIAELKSSNDFLRREYQDGLENRCRVREQIQAIGTLINSIFPKN